MNNVDENMVISEKIAEFIDLSDAELKEVTGGRHSYQHHYRRHIKDDSCDDDSCDSCDDDSCDDDSCDSCD
jgi:hypothetical protein